MKDLEKIHEKIYEEELKQERKRRNYDNLWMMHILKEKVIEIKEYILVPEYMEDKIIELIAMSILWLECIESRKKKEK